MTREHHSQPLTRVAGHLRWWWLLLAFAMPAIYPALLWNSGAVAYDAALQHILRGLVFSGAISDGVLYPRWTQFLQYGLGSPLFTFQGPLPYYALDLLYRIGIPHPIGWRIIVAAGLLAAALGAYLLVYAITRQRWPAVLAAVAYLYAPYVLRNTYERGSNEAFSMFLYPWVLWALVWLAQLPSTRRFIIATLIWAACIGMHVLGPLMLAPVTVAVVLLAAWHYRTAAPLAALLVGGLLTAFIWAPMVPEQSYVHIERDFSSPDALPWNNPLPLDRLLALPAVYDTAREINDTGDRVGILQMALLIAAAPAAVYAWRRRRRELAVSIGLAVVVGLILFWLFTNSSDAVWRLFAPVLGRVQYRMRLMGLQALAAAVAGGLALAIVSPSRQGAIAAVLAILLIGAALPSLYISLRHEYLPLTDTVTWEQVRDTEIRMGGKSLTAYAEFTPRWSDMAFDDRLLADITPRFDPQLRPLADAPADVQASHARVSSNSWDLDIAAAQPFTATLYLLYYPRWRATVDGRSVALAPEKGTGYAQLPLSAGAHHVGLRYAVTPVEAAGFVVSGLALLGLCLLPLVSRRGSLWKQTGRLTRLSSQPVANGVEVSRSPALGLDAPPLWLLIGLTAMLAIKIGYVDYSTGWLRCTSTAERVCDAQSAANVAFAGGTRLRGYSVTPTQLRPGEVLRVNLFWQADYPIKIGESSFLHLRNSQKDLPLNPRTSDEIWVQDHHDGPGGFFTTGYIPNRIYTEEYRVSIPADMPPGTYLLETGWSDIGTGDQIEPLADTVKPPLKVLWRSILLPSVIVQ